MLTVLMLGQGLFFVCAFFLNILLLAQEKRGGPIWTCWSNKNAAEQTVRERKGAVSFKRSYGETLVVYVL